MKRAHIPHQAIGDLLANGCRVESRALGRWGIITAADEDFVSLKVSEKARTRYCTKFDRGDRVRLVCIGPKHYEIRNYKQDLSRMFTGTKKRNAKVSA